MALTEALEILHRVRRHIAGDGPLPEVEEVDRAIESVRCAIGGQLLVDVDSSTAMMQRLRLNPPKRRCRIELPEIIERIMQHVSEDRDLRSCVAAGGPWGREARRQRWIGRNIPSLKPSIAPKSTSHHLLALAAFTKTIDVFATITTLDLSLCDLGDLFILTTIATNLRSLQLSCQRTPMEVAEILRRCSRVDTLALVGSGFTRHEPETLENLDRIDLSIFRQINHLRISALFYTLQGTFTQWLDAFPKIATFCVDLVSLTIREAQFLQIFQLPEGLRFNRMNALDVTCIDEWSQGHVVEFLKTCSPRNLSLDIFERSNADYRPLGEQLALQRNLAKLDIEGSPVLRSDYDPRHLSSLLAGFNSVTPTRCSRMHSMSLTFNRMGLSAQDCVPVSVTALERASIKEFVDRTMSLPELCSLWIDFDLRDVIYDAHNSLNLHAKKMFATVTLRCSDTLYNQDQFGRLHNQDFAEKVLTTVNTLVSELNDLWASEHVFGRPPLIKVLRLEFLNKPHGAEDRFRAMLVKFAQELSANSRVHVSASSRGLIFNRG